jgi:hypothetical protein
MDVVLKIAQQRLKCQMKKKNGESVIDGASVATRKTAPDGVQPPPYSIADLISSERHRAHLDDPTRMIHVFFVFVFRGSSDFLALTF